MSISKKPASPYRIGPPGQRDQIIQVSGTSASATPSGEGADDPHDGSSTARRRCRFDVAAMGQASSAVVIAPGKRVCGIPN